MPDDLFDAWFMYEQSRGPGRILGILRERPNAQPAARRVLRSLIPKHYWSPETIERRLKKWGYDKALSVLKKHLPETKKARSGDLGEILATEFVNRKLSFKVPIFKLRWRDDREMPLRGNDILGIRVDAKKGLHFLKGEAKSKVALSATVVQEGQAALRRHKGRPAPYTLNFVVNRLDELGEVELCDST